VCPGWGTRAGSERGPPALRPGLGLRRPGLPALDPAPRDAGLQLASPTRPWSRVKVRHNPGGGGHDRLPAGVAGASRVPRIPSTGDRARSVGDHAAALFRNADGARGRPRDLAESVACDALTAAGARNVAAAVGVSGRCLCRRDSCRRDRCRSYCRAATAPAACLMRAARGARRPRCQIVRWSSRTRTRLSTQFRRASAPPRLSGIAA
jgi:hypothetical protein